MLTWTPTSTNAEHAAREVISAAMWMHSTFKDEVWLWRGQAKKTFGIEPGMHTRVLNSKGFEKSEATVQRATLRLLSDARSVGLHHHDSIKLPDLALLATLQHHGAATPLLDVTTDPLIALWMVAFGSVNQPHALDGESGMLIGIKRPPKKYWIGSLDARAYAKPPSEGQSSFSSVAENFENNLWWYQAPDVTERLRIQRGSFLIGPFLSPKSGVNATIPLNLGGTGKNWLDARMEKRGSPSNTSHSTSDAFGIIVRGSVKRELRKLLIERSGLSAESIYPTPWLRPFIEEFANQYGRSRPLALDLA